MKLVGCILVAGVLGILAFIGPLGWYVLAAIIVGVIFRSFWLLKEIHQHTVPVDAYDGVNDAYERYILEREEREKQQQNG
ncbi:ATP-dependent Lon protease [Sporosarcina ureae]|uniref:ATP-dependent Lon protease n=1 Tax=Sporosarcina TaxID=1569 RepID=UPI000A14B021|nr:MULTISPECIES: ATP-dependent Lon protease [Sporosarcina]ARJ39357.1 ATP-dependent Lon protease [Sporosarcina ureae]PIC83597.1 ATP-dependent Lon protease [Sporosarcina sp. P1]